MAAADAKAIRSAARQAALLTLANPRAIQLRDIRYWELMRSGLTNTAVCKILGVSRRLGSRIRHRSRYQTVAQTPAKRWSGRYLSLPERLKIADLLSFGWSLRKIAVTLGRSPSTIKRELDRHRDGQGRYLPQSADHAAQKQRRRPREHMLVANPRLRRLVQRKLSRYWSPDEISGWLRRTHPDDPQMRLSPETIYRALLVPGGANLHERYCQRLRTGRVFPEGHRLVRALHRKRQGSRGRTEQPTTTRTRLCHPSSSAARGDQTHLTSRPPATARSPWVLCLSLRASRWGPSERRGCSSRLSGRHGTCSHRWQRATRT